MSQKVNVTQCHNSNTNFGDLELMQIVQAASDYVKLVLEGQMPLELTWCSWAKYKTHKW
ncbi:hypothetical protein CROQUDRAFT_96365 [Cronartium quercuum f. sp. fusiforme G11]|uniref:Uncharacterized protein n=1 Tax=Cronartium quercuum f. sp. fusiforme G11 TaxID=708437 RepID=A0A9P6T9B0_9BASI|nr:hypothetical protein CROQUDRAFT_96365 [Cronartium quercuum f. sp. fusiforme G11]